MVRIFEWFSVPPSSVYSSTKFSIRIRPCTLEYGRDATPLYGYHQW
jgi:hypothetical protein